MKKISIVFLATIMVVSGFQIIGAEIKQDESNFLTAERSFNEISLNNEYSYISVVADGVNDFIEEPGHPRLPVYSKVFKISGKAKIIDVICDFSDMETQELSKKVIPAPQIKYKIISDENTNNFDLIENKEIYSTNELYPPINYEYSIRCGLDFDGTPTTFVCIQAYPIRYNPIKNTLYSFSDVQINVEFENINPGVETSAADSYDLVIIAPGEFVNDLQPLVDHKISMGLSTTIKTTEEILSEYAGRDEPEQIKYFIKDAKENWNTSFILLFGGLKSYLYAKDKDSHSHGAKAWHVPVRYTNIQEADEVGCVSDLYYADLYRYNEDLSEWEFEDWDSNGDGIFAKYSMMSQGRDELDLVPDIYVGRLACRNKFELKIIRDKIINYESTSPSEKPWFNKIIGITGKNFDMWEGQPDGEFLVDRAIENMSRWVDEEVRVYASNVQSGNGPIPNTEDIIEEISKGAGFVDFEGHGNPIKWNTIHADGDYEDHDWVGGIDVSDFLKFSNGDKLPIVMVGGCHNALFNISILRVLLTRSSHPNYYERRKEAWLLNTLQKTGLDKGNRLLQQLQHFLAIQVYR